MLSQRKKQHLHYLYAGGGVPAVVAWFVRACLSPLYYREARYILAKRVPEQSPSDSGKKEKDTEVGCFTLESLEALSEVAQELPASFTHSLKSFRTHLEERGIIILVLGPQEDGTERKVVAYTLYQRGVLSLLGREKAVPFNMLFAKYGETLPAYRGQKYYAGTYLARDGYCRRSGIQFVCTTIAPDNRPALKSALARDSYHIIATVARVSILRGRFVWETPWEKIEAALQDFIQQESHS